MAERVKQTEWDTPYDPLVAEGKMTLEKFVEMSITPNRRLVHIIPEKFSSLDLRRLSKA